MKVVSKIYSSDACVYAETGLTPPPRNTKDLLFGIEMEYHNSCPSHSKIYNIFAALGITALVKSESSLSDGVKISTLALPAAAHLKQWKDFWRCCAEAEVRLRSDAGAGMYIHFPKRLASTLTLGKLVRVRTHTAVVAFQSPQNYDEFASRVSQLERSLTNT